MDAEEARRRLRSADPQERLLAARALRDRVRATDREALEDALRREDDHYVQLAIRRALLGVRHAPVAPESDARTLPASEPADLTGIATQLIHEFAKTLGVLEVYARDEVTAYVDSQTARQIEQLKTVVEQTRSLREAASPAELHELNPAPLLRDLARDVTLSTGWDAFVFDGDPTATVLGSRSHLELAVRNALANAVESNRAVDANASIAVSWGEDDREYWICVHDSGTGLAAAADELYKIGVTTKANGSSHGFGLAIAHQAAAAVSGRIELADRLPRGASFKLRWPKAETE